MSAHIDSIKIPLLSAFPNGNKTPENMGLMMRDYFAARAPENPPHWFDFKFTEDRKLAETQEMRYFRWRYAYADAMMKAREQ